MHKIASMKITIIAFALSLVACGGSVDGFGGEAPDGAPELEDVATPACSGATCAPVTSAAISSPAPNHPRYFGGCINTKTGAGNPNGSACELPMQGGAGHCDWTIPAPASVCVPNDGCSLYNGGALEDGTPCHDAAGVPGVCVLAYDAAGVPRSNCEP